MSDEKKIAAGNSYFGFDKLDRVRDLFEKKYGDLVNRPVLDEIHEQLELCKSQAEVKALIDRVSDKAFLDKLIKKNPFAYKDETNKEFDHNLEYNLEENNFENLTDIKGNFPEEYENLTENTDNFDDIKDNFHENIEKSTKITKNLAKTDQNLAEDDTNISENNPKFEKTNENNSKNAEKQLIAAKTRIINNLLAKGYPRELAEKVQVEQNIESVPMNELIPRDENVLYLDSPSEAHPALDPHNITEADFETFLKQNDQVVENDPQKSVDFSEIADFAKITQEKFGKTQKLDEFLVSATDSSEAECEGRDEDRFEEYMSRREIFMRKWLSDRRQESMDEKEKKIEIDIKTSENAEISLEAPEITEIALKTRESAEIDSNPIPKAYEIKLDETHQNIRETFQKDLPRLKRLLGNETVFISTTMDYPLTPENSAYIEILKSREKPLLSHLDGLADLEEMRAAMSTNRFKELDEMQRHVENDDPVSMREAYEKLTIGGADGDNENARLIDSLRDKAIDAEEEIGGEVVAQVREFEMEDGCTDFDDTEANKESWDEDTLDEDKEKEPDDEKLVAFGESSEDDRRRERAAEEKENQKDGDLDDEEGEFTDLLEEAGRKMGL